MEGFQKMQNREIEKAGILKIEGVKVGIVNVIKITRCRSRNWGYWSEVSNCVFPH